MPIFEYLCKECDNAFEKIVQGSKKPDCPSCGSKKLEKQLSVFAVSGGSGNFQPGPATGPCGSCGDPRGPGACSLN